MMGFNDFQNFKQHPRTDVVAICDVDAGNLERALKEVPNARPYRDWREMLAKEGGRIDSINATVPDHMHAAICLSAMRAGKHVYCQKPMCHDVANSILDDTPCESSFDQSGPMSEAVILGTVAVRTPGVKLEWDAKTLKIPNSAEANALLRRSYREGWHIEGLG